MGKDFKSYVNDNPNLKSKKNDKLDEQKVTDAVENITRQYGQKSEEELTNEILDRVKKGKADGSINVAELENMSKIASSMLNFEQQQRLTKIMELIKKQ